MQTDIDHTPYDTNNMTVLAFIIRNPVPSRGTFGKIFISSVVTNEKEREGPQTSRLSTIVSQHRCGGFSLGQPAPGFLEGNGADITPPLSS